MTDLKQAVANLLVGEYGWDAADARQAVDEARVCVDGVKPADLPDDVDVRRQLTLTSECMHCDAELEMTKRVAEYLAEGH